MLTFCVIKQHKNKENSCFSFLDFTINYFTFKNSFSKYFLWTLIDIEIKCLCASKIRIRIISIICIVLTLLSALNLVKIAVTGDVGYDLPILYNGSYIMALYVQSSVILVHLFTYIILLLGSLYKSKMMSIPTLIISSLQVIVINYFEVKRVSNL